MASRAAGMGLRERFLGWQCRIRQIAMRQDGGRPSPGMQPHVLSPDGGEIAAALTVLLVPERPEESTAFLRFQVLRETDPRKIYERGLAFLQGEYFQLPESFSDRLAAVLPQDSDVAARFGSAGTCVLVFDQFGQRFRLPCGVNELGGDDAVREAAVWHNRVFNPLLPDTVRVFSFSPDWAASTATP